jgi:hypothetical protein
MSKATELRRVEARLDREHHAGSDLGVVARVEERPLVVAQADRVPGVVAPVRPERVLLEGRPHGSVDIRAGPTRADRVERDVLELNHMREHPFLLGGRIADEHRSLELGEVAPDRRACARHEHVALLEHEVPGERMRDRGVASDLPPIPGVSAAREEALRPVDLTDRVEHREGGLVARAL